MIPVVLSGGSGTRLWPASRTKLPKQFCEIFEDSLQVLTLKRLAKLGTPWTVTSQGLKDLTIKTLRGLNLPDDQVIYEPVAKNTAPAIAVLAHVFQQRGYADEVVGIFPADHLIENEPEFIKAVTLAESEAKNGKIVTLGISPTFPSTGFGYIQTQSHKSLSLENLSSFQVEGFHEKPNFEKAESFLKAGNFHWNAGIFIFKVNSMIEAFKTLQPEIWKSVQQIKQDCSNLNEVYANLQSISIDYAIMEKLSSSQLVCIPCDIGWSDVGSWDAIAQIMGVDKDKGSQQINIDAKNNFVIPNGQKQYAFVGVEDLIVVDTADALLISKKGSTEKVKNVVDQLKMLNSTLVNDHIYEYRPWGKYEILKNEEHFKSKVIQVLPGQQISYQSHAQREEHWLITKGAGEVILEDQCIPVKAGTYVKIPLGAKHRIKNPNKELIEFVEVQMGQYFGEDDIVRYQDDYKRI